MHKRLYTFTKHYSEKIGLAPQFIDENRIAMIDDASFSVIMGKFITAKIIK